LQQWSNTWLLKFHPKKCKVMTFGRSGHQYQYMMTSPDSGTTILTRTTAEKDLGVIFDPGLAFRVEIQGRVKKANNIMDIIQRMYIHLDIVSFKLLVTALVRSHLEYGALIWFPRQMSKP
ncbi:hypothetical protein CAPTEDRAFT_101426, partial [Capitella teleta]